MVIVNEIDKLVLQFLVAFCDQILPTNGIYGVMKCFKSMPSTTSSIGRGATDALTPPPLDHRPHRVNRLMSFGFSLATDGAQVYLRPAGVTCSLSKSITSFIAEQDAEYSDFPPSRG